MPPKKVPIYCLVHGDPETFVFRVRYDKNTTVDDFKDTILIRKKNAFVGVDSPDLILYKVDIDLNTQNPQRTALGNPEANIVNNLGGQVLSPMDNIEENFPALANKHIYIIIDVAVPVATRRNDDVIITRLDKLDQNIDRIDKNVEEKKLQYTYGVTEGYWTKIKESTGIDYQSTTREIELPNLDLDLRTERIDAFGWMTDTTERSQSDRYKPYLTNILKIATFRTLGLHDPAGDDSFLSTNTDILPIRLSGTTDLVIVDRHSIASQAQEKHIRILFELKKIVYKKHTFQTMAELISADLKSTYPVLAVLTDLIDDWHFFWIKGKIIMRLTLPRAESVALIRHNLASMNDEMRELADQASSERTEMDIESSSSEEEQLEQLPKRQKLRHVIATSNVGSDIAPMEDFFDTMSEEDIFRYKAKQILTQFFSQPIFNELNDQKKIPPQADNEKNVLD